MHALILPALRVPRRSTAGATGLHRDGRREAPEAPRLLPGVPHHRENRHHAQLGEDDQRDQGAGDPPGAQEPHESGVSRARGTHVNHKSTQS